jgi:hypothetical protein
MPSITEVTDIAAVRDPDVVHGFAEVLISSPTGVFRLRCDRNTDEIIFTRLRIRRSGATALLTGKHRVEWMWILQNQQGYQDGFRIQLAGKKGSRSFEFISIASVIHVFEAKEWPNNPMHLTASRVMDAAGR